MTTITEAIRQTRRDIAQAESPVRRDLVALYREAYASIERDLSLLMDAIRERHRQNLPVSPDWLRQEGRYRSLLVSIDREIARFTGGARVILATGQREAVEIGRNGAASQASAAGYAVDLGATAPVVPMAQERLVSAIQPGSPLADTLSRYPARVRAIIERELFLGIVEGQSPREVARRIRRKANGPLVYTRIESTARTEMLRALRGSLTDSYGRLGVDTVVWRATRSTRTCLACLALDGTEYPLREAPTSQHPNCRCILSPAPTPQYIADNGQIMTGEQWFRRQPASVQREMVGNEDAYAAFRRGDIRLEDFIGYRVDGRWGMTVQQRSAAEVLRTARRAA